MADLNSVHSEFNMNNSLPKGVYIGCSISLLLVVVVGFLSLYTSDRQKDEEIRIEHTSLVLGGLDNIQNLLMDMESGRRGFRGTGDVTYLEPYKKSLSELPAALTNLKGLVSTDPEQTHRMANLQRQTVELIDFWNSLKTTEINYSRSQIKEITAVEKKKMDAIRTLMAGIYQKEKTVLTQLKKSNYKLRQRTEMAIATGTLLILGIVSILVYVVIREFKNRVQDFQIEHEMNEQKSAFITLASHEFRTPLSSIQLSASLIEKYVEQFNSTNIIKHSHRIKVAVEHLTTILDDFLSLERLETGKVKAVFETFDLVATCKEVQEEMEMIAKPHQTIVYQHSGGNSMVLLDRNLVKNALINLISNAVKYSGDDTTINIDTEITASECKLTVKDNGIGIPESEQKQLFQPFFRAGNTGNIPGTGLGLNIVLRYVKLMNGDLSFESKLNHGSSFTLIFPLIKNETEAERDAGELKDVETSVV